MRISTKTYARIIAAILTCLCFMLFHVNTLHDNTERNPAIRERKIMSLFRLGLKLNEDSVDFDDVRAQIKGLATKLNREQVIKNIDRFGLNLKKRSVVIVVQVHNRVDTFRLMVESLRSVRFINESLLVFSHDVFSEEIFQIVKSIDFCPVLQLFYPYAIQIFNNRFPGNHPNDCPRNINRSSAIKLKCINALFPDHFNHYREGRFCQIKHHWMWKLHFVFDRVTVLRGYEGTVLLLEDDYYLADDTIYFLRKMKQQQKTSCPTCNMFVLGGAENEFEKMFEKAPQRVISQFYYPSCGNAMALSRRFWEDLKLCATEFCTWDDYNFDYSLHNTLWTCMRGGLTVMKTMANRVFHIGTCQGFHRPLKRCNTQAIVSKIRRVLEKYESKLFPEEISVTFDTGKHQVMQKNGGWADPRDHQLCLSFINNVTDSADLHHGQIKAN